MEALAFVVVDIGDNIEGSMVYVDSGERVFFWVSPRKAIGRGGTTLGPYHWMSVVLKGFDMNKMIVTGQNEVNTCFCIGVQRSFMTADMGGA